jgi:hypothetical protein
MSPDEARAFVASNHRAVLITRRRGGGLQASPVLVGVDDQEKVVISTREGADKTPASLSRPSPPRLDRRRFTLWLGVRAASAVGRLAEMAC